MTAPHLANLVVHVVAGVLGIVLGVVQLARPKADAVHRRRGRWFAGAALVVTGSALVGTIAFRFMPLFAVLTLLTTYVTVSGWRTALSRERGPAPVDLAWTALGVLGAVLLVPALSRAPQVGNSRPVVVWSALGGLGIVLAYDLVRWRFPDSWRRRG